MQKYRFADQIKIGAVIFVLLAVVTLTPHHQKGLSTSKADKNFANGEQLHYKIMFGIFKMGTGFIEIEKKLHTVQSKPCYRVNAFGKTSDVISWIAKVNDQIWAYVDTTTLLTHIGYRKLREGNYHVDEISMFDHKKNVIEMKVKNQETGKFKTPKTYDIPKNTRDILSGFLYMRTLDFKKMNPGDTIELAAFLEDTIYDFKILYVGKEKLETNLGWISCIKLLPIMPKNDLFDGKNSISYWLSDDDNRIPIKMQMKMFIGNFKIEIMSFRGLPNQLKIIFE